MQIHKILVKKCDDGLRVNKFLNKSFKKLPFSVIAKLVRIGKIRVNDKKVGLNDKLKQDDEIRISLPDNQELRNTKKKHDFSEIEKNLAKRIEQKFLYKDENIIALDKPPGIAVQGGSNIVTSIDLLSELWKFEYDEKPRLVHRLDKDTSGVLILARNKEAARVMSYVFKERMAQKNYIAILNGVPKNTTDIIDIPIAKQYLDKLDFQCVGEKQDGKDAITEYRVLDFIENDKIQISLVEFTLITGRTHQIRAHSAAIGCPVLGDEKYTLKKHLKNTLKKEKNLFLHAMRIKFHAFGKNFDFKTNIPQYFKEKLHQVGLCY